MIYDKIGNLLEAKDVDCIAHVTNLYKTFGAGIALQIKKKFPELYMADRMFDMGDEPTNKIGSISIAVLSNGILGVNIYAMNGIGQHHRQLNYEALISCLESLRGKMRESNAWRLGIPFGMGAGLAGGNWSIIRPIIEWVFDRSGIDVYIYKYET